MFMLTNLASLITPFSRDVISRGGLVLRFLDQRIAGSKLVQPKIYYVCGFGLTLKMPSKLKPPHDSVAWRLGVTIQASSDHGLK
ncbi:hypothetical protein AVEN_126937-1 [Araneus ventricosus]|uniref:Uncharacterized protein n=1 Tax=Araneus ventricosus TaxID=182803 RepID=A0A4Y2VS60_ARAVE|nr:hypothetical protein AVEN_126937-1 [Araneus ventricosus]